jgi:hypothetical protein
MAGALDGATNNVGVGFSALNDLTSGDENVCVGAYAGDEITTHSQNTLMGYGAGHRVTANGNVLIGYLAGDNVTTGASNTGVGTNVAFDVDANNQTCIGNEATTSAANAVKIGNGSVSAANIQVDWTIDSDIRIKKDVEDNTLGLSFINSLKPKKYRKLHPADWDKEIREKRYEKGERDEFDDVKVWDGLIAQDVKESIDESGTTFSGWSEDANGKQGIQYSAMVVPLIKAVQELSAEVKSLKQQLEDK